MSYGNIFDDPYITNDAYAWDLKQKQQQDTEYGEQDWSWMDELPAQLEFKFD